MQVKNITSKFNSESILKSIALGIAFVLYVSIMPKDCDSSKEVTHGFLSFWEASWLFFSHVFSTIVTLFILLKIIEGLPNDSTYKTKYVARICYAGLILTLLITSGIGILLFLKRYEHITLEIPLWLFYAYTAFIVLFFIVLDYTAYYTNKKSGYTIFLNLTEENWKSIKKYNWIVVIGFIGILYLSFHTKNHYSEALATGVSGGAIAFQLIVAHLFFEIENYKIKNNDDEKSKK